MSLFEWLEPVLNPDRNYSNKCWYIRLDPNHSGDLLIRESEESTPAEEA